MTPFLHVIKPGLQTTIQDLGRWGLQAEGVTVAGPMDPVSHRLANALVGNSPDAAALEITLRGPELRFADDRVVAVTGAVFELTLDGQPLEAARSPLHVPAGSVLRFGERSFGTRAYMAIAGGLDSTPVLGSRATHVASRMGGIGGRALVAGDSLRLGRSPVQRDSGYLGLASRGSIDLTARLACGEGPSGGRRHHGRVRVLPGPQLDRFASDALERLQSAPYVIANESDRAGYRLRGPLLQDVCGRDLISEPMPLGSLQVPASQQPILLMADRHTTGGYPKLATLISADHGVAGQLGPGDLISFEVVSLAEALVALRSLESELAVIEGKA